MALHLTTDHSTLCPTPLHRQHDPAECAVPCSRRSCTPTTGRPPSAAPPGPRHSPRTPPIPAPQPWGACPASPRPLGSTAPPLPAPPLLHTPARGAPYGTEGGVARSSRRRVRPRLGGVDEGGAGGERSGGARGVHVKRHPAAPSPPNPPPPQCEWTWPSSIPHLPLSLLFSRPIQRHPASRQPPPATLALATEAPHTCTPPGTLTPALWHLAHLLLRRATSIPACPAIPTPTPVCPCPSPTSTVNHYLTFPFPSLSILLDPCLSLILPSHC